MADRPVTYLIFDLLYLDGRSLVDRPYTERRERLAELELDGPTGRRPATTAARGGRSSADHGARARGTGRQAARQPLPPGAAQQRLAEGEEHPQPGARDRRVAPRPGPAGRDDRRHRGRLPRGRRRRARLRYAGESAAASPTRSWSGSPGCSSHCGPRQSPFEVANPPGRAVFVEPRLVAEVEFREWTAARTLRAPVYKGLRTDKDPAAVVLEQEEAPPSP